MQGVFVPFFGRVAYTPRAAADLAIRFGAPVVVGTIHRKADGPGHVLETIVPLRATGRQRSSDSPRPALLPWRRPSAGTPKSGSGCTSAGKPAPRKTPPRGRH